MPLALREEIKIKVSVRRCNAEEIIWFEDKRSKCGVKDII